jgi:hypothetical protein
VVDDGFVHRWVERLACLADTLDADAPQGIHESLVGKCNACAQG